jgi:nucleolar GTP-binding protein
MTGGDDRRGRKRRRSVSDSDNDEDMEDDDNDRGASKKSKRSMTPAQLKIRASSKVRSMSKGRREGSVPQPHPTRAAPEAHIRLAKKINKRFKHSINVNEADRVVTTKKPKHLYAGKRGIGKNDRR